MSHWSFLEEKLGSDIVKYIIQPMLMPSKEDIIDAKDDVIFALNKYGVSKRQKTLTPSQIYLQEVKQRCSGCNQRLWAYEMSTCDICGAYICDQSIEEFEASGIRCNLSIGHWDECRSCAGKVKVNGQWEKD